MANCVILISDSGALYCVDSAGTITSLDKNDAFVDQQKAAAGDNPVAPVDPNTANKLGCGGAVAAIIMAKLP